MKKAIAIVLASTLLLGTTSSFAYAGGKHRHGHGGHGGAFAGALLGGVFLGHALSQPRHAPQPAPAPAYRNCHPTTSVGFANGYRAEFVGTMCYDAWGNGYIVPQSQRFVRYLP
jgi:hypothetical protein